MRIDTGKVFFMYKYVLAPTQLNDIKSQIKLVFSALKEYLALTPAFGGKPPGKSALSLVKFQNIIARELGYSSFSELTLKVDCRKDNYKPVPLFDLIDVDKVVGRVGDHIPELMVSDIRNALGFLFSAKTINERYGLVSTTDGVSLSEYPYVCELKDMIDGCWVSSLGTECVVPEMYPKGDVGYKQYLNDVFRHASDEVWLEYQNDPSVGVLGGAATRTFKSLAHLDRFIASRIASVRAGAFGGSWDYLTPLLLDVSDGDVVAVLGEVSRYEPISEVDGLDDSLLVDYCEIHNQTDLALFSGHQLKRLSYLGGTLGMPVIRLDNNEFASNHSLVGDMVEAAKKLRRRFEVC